MVFFDLRGKVVFACENYSRHYGYGPSELMGALVTKFLAMNDQFRIRKSIDNWAQGSLKGCQPYRRVEGVTKTGQTLVNDGESRIVRLDGRPYICITAYPTATRYIFDGPKTMSDAVRSWHRFVYSNSHRAGKMGLMTYRFVIEDPDVVIWADPIHDIWRNHDTETKVGVTLGPITGQSWLDYWRGEALRSDDVEPSQAYMFQFLNKYRGSYLDHVLQDAGLAPEPLDDDYGGGVRLSL